jgi:FkbM family methyltransferase
LIVNTRRLFCRLLRTFDVATVCDVGSMDGDDALRFRRVLPSASILALEPNPNNFALMAADDRLGHERIRVLPVAASDRRAKAPFFVIDANYARGRDLARRGMSSLHERSDWTRLSSVVQVQTVRLDELLAAESSGAGPIALWIDAEGAAFEVPEGRAIALCRCGRSATKPFCDATHRTAGFESCERALLEAGFVLLATDQQPDVLQFNALFVSAAASRAKLAEVARQAHYERLRRRVTRTIVHFMPMRVRLALGRRLFETRCQ